MNKLFVLLGVFLLSVMSLPASELEQIRKQICTELLATPASADVLSLGEWSVEKWNANLMPDGSWTDVPYEDKNGGGWRPAMHMRRVYDMLRAYRSPGNKLYQNPALAKDIHSTFGYWLQKDYQSPNWFYNEIYLPRYAAQILLLLDDEATPAEIEQGLKIASRATLGKKTGQNRVWSASVRMMRGVLEKNMRTVAESSQVIADAIEFTPDEGLQQDFSFHQHGRQLETGNYGLAFALTIAPALVIPSGTSLAISDEKVAIMRDYLLQGLAFAVWKESMDISSCGRQLFPGRPNDKARNVSIVAEMMKKADPSHAAEYQNVINAYHQKTAGGPSLLGNRMFWRSDYMLHRRPDFLVSTKMSSSRVKGSELINKENTSGRYLGRGATYVYLTGDEYADIFPVWDWRRIPGVTNRQNRKIPLMPSSEILNRSAFVGGVSDGTYGATAYEGQIVEQESYTKPKETEPSLFYKKSVFYFDDGVVCLGTGITSGSGQIPMTESAVTTSVNQCLPRGNCLFEDRLGEHTVTLKEGVQTASGLLWAWQDSVGYIFPGGQDAQIGVQEQSGNWQEIYATGTPENLTKPVFSLWLDHGPKPMNVSYQYIILPASTPENVKAFAQKPTVEILSNSASLQAVRHPKSELVFAVFYEPGSVEYARGKTLTVDRPGIVMIHGTGATPQITVADPTELLTSMNVTVNGKSQAVELPPGMFAGQSKLVALPSSGE